MSRPFVFQMPKNVSAQLDDDEDVRDDVYQAIMPIMVRRRSYESTHLPAFQGPPTSLRRQSRITIMAKLKSPPIKADAEVLHAYLS